MMKYKFTEYVFFSVGIICFLVFLYFDNLNRSKKYIKIDSNAEFNFVVNELRAENGYILNNKYYYGGGNFLQKNNNYPNWLLEEKNINDGNIIKYEDGRLIFDIDKIKRPFALFKKSNSNILNLVKNGDTLQFRISY